MQNPSLNVLPLPVVNALSFEDEVLRPDTPVLVDVSSTWCAPCRAAEPVLRQIVTDLEGQLKVVKIDADDAPELIARLSVRGFPTFILFTAGKEVSRHAGFRSSNKSRSWIDQALRH